ncbi:MAG TPA: hypothetical protein VFB58_14355 [Chloroflexota bacterium]|nr:hypothetical protein [Chloroflexota bacterium]
MAYLRSTGGDPVPPDRIRALASLFGLSVPVDDFDTLSVALRDQLASIAQLEALNLAGVTPLPAFDPRWHE